MKRFINIGIVFCVVSALLACAPEDSGHTVKHYCSDFEGDYWNALVDSNPNGNNLTNGSIATSWHDEKSGIAGVVTIPYEGYWGGLALSNHCSKDLQNHGSPTDQLYAHVDSAYSGTNFLICNCFWGGVELSLGEEPAYIESIMVAHTTYSYAVTTQGNHLTAPLDKSTSIWIEASGYIDGSDEVQATAKFYLYKNGEPAFEGWEKWYMTSMSKVNKIVFDVKWSGKDYNPYPAYFAMDDIKLVRHKAIR
ncbi:MAG: DUF4465 domain-containing protein [Alistipes sp.]|nr:DUF4465 domain-containing protein [Alistipes sp.]